MLESKHHLSWRLDAGIEVACNGVDPWVRRPILLAHFPLQLVKWKLPGEEIVVLVRTGYTMAVRSFRIVFR